MPPAHVRKESTLSAMIPQPLENLASRVLGFLPSSPSSQSPTPQPEDSSKEATSAQKLSADNTVVIGVLHKWVNIGRGWNFRLFILEKGVLSYYKIDGPDAALVGIEVAKRKGARCIGEETSRMLKKDMSQSLGSATKSTKPLGEVHLQVSTIRPSETDDKKFYVFSGTKTLHLRTDHREERQAWLDTLMMVKEFFALAPSMVDLPPLTPIQISTLPLRERLSQLNLSEDVVTECEEIVTNQICGSLWETLKKERQQKRKLLSRLKQLEVDKQELETQVVQEALYQQGENSFIKPTTAVENEDGSEENFLLRDSDDEAEFFEALESFDSSVDFSFPRIKSDPTFAMPPNPTADIFRSVISSKDLPLEDVGHQYPVLARRNRLPKPKQPEKPSSLWSVIKDNVGKDLSHICLPVYFNEPISTLQKVFEEIEYSSLLDKAAEYGRRGDQLMRAVYVATFAASAYACTAGRGNKPFNPLLGETFEALWEDKGLRFISEKVSHRPNVMACHCEGQGWTFWGDSNLKNKFWGPSITLEPTGVISIKFDDGELFEWTKVTTGIYNIILGKPYVDHYGTMTISGNKGLSMVMNFKQPSIIDRHLHQVRGYVKDDSSGEKLATLMGKWDESIYYLKGDLPRYQLKLDPSSIPGAVEVWRRHPPAKYPTRYNLTSFAIQLNEMTPGLEEWLPPTDCRFRPDQRALEEGIFDYANEEKLRLEQRQRQARKQQEVGWVPKWFEQKGPHNTWCYTGGYWERRAEKNWTGIPDIYNIDSLMLSLKMDAEAKNEKEN